MNFLKFIVCFLIFFSAKVHAFNLDIMIKSKNKVLMAPILNVTSGKPAKVSYIDDNKDGHELEVLATKNDKNEILMKFKLYEVEKGIKRILFKPTLIGSFDKENTCKMEDFSLYVAPRK